MVLFEGIYDLCFSFCTISITIFSLNFPLLRLYFQRRHIFMLDRNLVGTICVICTFLSIILYWCFLIMMDHLFAVGEDMFMGQKVGISTFPMYKTFSCKWLFLIKHLFKENWFIFLTFFFIHDSNFRKIFWGVKMILFLFKDFFSLGDIHSVTSFMHFRFIYTKEVPCLYWSFFKRTFSV